MQKRICKLIKMDPPAITNQGQLFSSGLNVPADGVEGYQTGCIFQKTNGGAGTSLYVNEGTYLAADFDAVAPADSALQVGTSGTHATDETSGGNTIGIFVDPSSTTAARYTTADIESLLSTQTFTIQGAGLYTIRGVAGLKTGAHYYGSANQGYLAGVQGKLTMTSTSILGNGSSGGIYAASVLAQMQFTAGATFGADVNMSGLWIDNQVGAALPSASQMLNITNNGGSVTTMVHMYGNNAITNVFSFETMDGSIITAASLTGTIKVLKCLIDGTTYYLPLYSSHT